MDLAAIEGLIIDMDGVLWRGEEPLPGLTRFFEVLRRSKVRFVLATNNASRRPEAFAEKARQFGVLWSAQEVISSASVTIDYLLRHYPPGTPVHVIGETPLREMVAEAGFAVVEDKARAVVVAMDRGMTYETLKRGTLLLRAGADFIVTNPDTAYPSDEGIVPGSGTMMAALMASSGRTPTVMGKPETHLFELALARLGLPKVRVASLGDRLDADVEGAHAVGLRAILVLSGYTRPEDLAASIDQPDLVCEDIGELATLLEAAHASRSSALPTGEAPPSATTPKRTTIADGTRRSTT